MKISKAFLKGSVTLESSFIYPMIIVISVLLIMYSFFIHDKIVLRSDMYRILIENNNDHSLSHSVGDICERLNEKCLLSHSFDAEYLDDSASLQITDTGSLNFGSVSTKVSFTGYERCDFIRKYYAILYQITKTITKE